MPFELYKFPILSAMKLITVEVTGLKHTRKLTIKDFYLKNFQELIKTLIGI